MCCTFFDCCKQTVICVSTGFAVFECLALVNFCLETWQMPDEKESNKTKCFYLATTILYVTANAFRIFFLWYWACDTPRTTHDNSTSGLIKRARVYVTGSVVAILVLYPITWLFFAITFFAAFSPASFGPNSFLSRILVFNYVAFVDLYMVQPWVVVLGTWFVYSVYKRAEKHRQMQQMQSLII